MFWASLFPLSYRLLGGAVYPRPSEQIFGIPEQANVTVTLEGIDTPLTLPWLGYSTTDLYTATDFEALCPASTPATANGVDDANTAADAIAAAVGTQMVGEGVGV